METDRIDKIVNDQRKYFDQGETRSLDFRVAQLVKLKNAIKKHESEVVDALRVDLHKPTFEAFVSEIGILYDEISFVIKNIKSWMKPQQVNTPLAMQPSSSIIHTEPLGLVLIISPWNYPFQLVITPLIGAIAAGNCSIVKPSNKSKVTAALVERILRETFEERYIAVVQGPGSVVGPLLLEKYRFDHIFFTGSIEVGKQVMRMAAKHLSPITLELGGKSPAIIDKDANIAVSARRLVWSKFFNAGQTCVSPDYILIHESVKKAFVDKMIHYVKEFYGEDPLNSEDYTHIVNEKRFNVLSNFLKDIHIIHGGRSRRETLCIEPTLVDEVAADHALMQEEIFGPILPIFTFREIEEVVPFIRKHRYPLSCYVFTSNKKTEEFVIKNIEFGGGCINNALIHLANSELPFGGVGYSGMGNYHGKNSFDVFSHKKSILTSRTFPDPSIRYPPYTSRQLKLARFFFK